HTDDALEGEGPVCARIEAFIEDTGMLDDVRDGVGVIVIEDSVRRPKDRSFLWRPNLDQAGSLAAREPLDGRRGTARHAEQNMPQSEGGRLGIVTRSARAGDGRCAYAHSYLV